LAFVAVVALAIAVAGVCRRFDVAAPLPLVATGLVLGMPAASGSLPLNPELVLGLALPPLLFAQALNTSYVGIRKSRRPILLLSVGLVIFTAATVAIAARATIPGLTVAVALTLGAVLAPTDAVAASAIGNRLGLRRRTMTILEGESLVNDGTALTIFRVALSAAVATSVTWAHSMGVLGVAVSGGILVGLLGGYVLRVLLRRLDDALLENAIILLAPFALYLAAEELHSSGFLAVVVAGLILSHSQSAELNYATRLQSTAVWDVVTYVLEAVAFVIIGFEIPELWRTLNEHQHEAGVPDATKVLLAATVVFLTILVSRFLWVFPGTYLPRILVPSIRANEERPSWRSVVIIGWAGIRGPVSLLAALGIPRTLDSGDPFPQRDVLLLITGLVVVATLTIQGLTLGPLVRTIRIPETINREEQQDKLAEAEAQHHAGQAALVRLEQELEVGPPVDEDVVRRLRDYAEHRTNSAWESLGGPAERPAEAYRRLRLAMLEAERDVFLSYRDRGRLPDEVLRRVFRELDLEQANLERG
jgi:CPA1 family monovalent cation:H+ antiporter